MMRLNNILRKTLLLATSLLSSLDASAETWIRINQLGYLPGQTKVAVLMSEEAQRLKEFRLVDAFTGETALRSKAVTMTGAMGRMQTTARLDFSRLRREGTYYIEAGAGRSAHFAVSNAVYDGAADFVLNYMRQQRCGWNPMIRDVCHQKDGFILGHLTKDSTFIDVRGGWHDATDCLQYTTTSANAIVTEGCSGIVEQTRGDAEHHLTGEGGYAAVIDDRAGRVRGGRDGADDGGKLSHGILAGGERGGPSCRSVPQGHRVHSFFPELDKGALCGRAAEARGISRRPETAALTNWGQGG